VSVAVFESGSDQVNNPLVTDPEKFGQSFGMDVDYVYHVIEKDQTGSDIHIRDWASHSIGPTAVATINTKLLPIVNVASLSTNKSTPDEVAEGD
jgi:hypothetical protein